MQSVIQVSAAQLRKLEGPYLTWIGGSPEAFALGAGSPETLQNSQLAFVSDLHSLSSAAEKASLLVLENKIAPRAPAPRAGQAIWSTPSLKAAMALVLPIFDPRTRIHEKSVSVQALVHPTAKIGARTRIAPGAIIGAGVEIGDDCLIASGAVIEDFCRIGSRCSIHANVVIGADGFGFATDPKGVHHKVPQIGIVVIEDDVEIGALTTIDRATLGETRIGQGSKFDKHCHVAHNCKVGRHNVFAAGFMMAGSSSFGDNCTVGGSTVVSDHVHIGNQIMVGGRSGLSKDVSKPGAYAGYPLETLRDNMRTTQNLTHLTRMRRQLKLISKKLGIESDSE